MNIREMKEKRNSLIEEMKQLGESAKAEKRNLNTEESDKFDSIDAQINDLTSSIKRAEKLAANEALIENFVERNEDNFETASEAKTAKRAFAKYLRSGMGALNPTELEIMQRSQTSSTDSAGGYLVPEEMGTLDIATVAVGAVEEVANYISTTSGGKIQFPNADDTSVVASIVGQGSAHGVSGMTFGNTELDSYTYSSNIVKVSRQLLNDEAFNLEGFLTNALGERLKRGINADLTTGNGSSKPNGVTNVASAGVTGVAAVSALTRTNILDLIHSVDPSYRKNGKLMFNDAVLAQIKKMSIGSGDDRPLWVPSMADGAPSTIEGFEYVVNQDMPSTGKIMLFGDFSRYTVREVGNIFVLRLDERYADELNVAFLAYRRIDGDLTGSSAAIKSLALA